MFRFHDLVRFVQRRSILALSVLPPILIFLLSFAAFPACASEKTAGAKLPAANPEEKVAEVAGKAITRKELEDSVRPQLQQLDFQRQQLLEQALTRLVEEKLLETEAATRGISKEDLVKAEVTDKVEPVTEGDVAKWFEENRARLGGRSLEQIGEQIKGYLEQLRSQDRRSAFLAELKTKHQARILLDVARVQVSEGNSPAKGPKQAPVTIIEFSDFECPFCNRVTPTLQEVLSTYGDQVRLVFRQFPLNSIHPRAQKAAEASLCAHEQGKFWEMHDAMFLDQKKLEVADLKAKASALGLDPAKFDACLDSGKYAEQVSRDLADGMAAGVTGTPALFINGRFLNGAVPFSEFERIIDDELLRKGIQPRKAATK